MFLRDYENRFERKYGYFRPIIKEVTEGHHEAWKAVVISSFIAQMFSREVFALLLRKAMISHALVEKITGWRHSGISAHSKVKAETKAEAERAGQYMIRPVLSLERLSFEEESKVSYWYGKEGEAKERMDYLEFIARVTSHIPDKGQVMVRYYGLC